MNDKVSLAQMFQKDVSLDNVPLVPSSERIVNDVNGDLIDLIL